jgi:DNA-binding response OmpR family regulator
MNPEKPSVLIVDHESAALKSVSSRLDPARFRAATCPFGSVAYEYVAQNKPDLVLLDANLLYVKGADSFQMMRETSPRTRVVFVDTEGPWTLLMDLPRRETNEMLINPCASDEVMGVVEHMIRIQAG